MLLEQNNLNPNIEEIHDGQRPLLWVAEKGYKVVVEILLGRNDLYLNTANTEHGRTALL